MAARAHIVVSEELLRDIDRVAGRRKRSRFVEAAVREKLAREALRAALAENAGVLDPSRYPEWATPEGTSSWVRSSRREDEARVAKKLAR